MLKKLKAFWAWLRMWWSKEEPKLAAAVSNFPADVEKASGWLARLNTAIGTFFKSALAFALDASKWWTLVKWTAFAGYSVSLYLFGHTGKAELKADLASAQENVTAVSKENTGLKADLNDAKAVVTQQKALIAKLEENAAPTPKPKNNSGPRTGSTGKKQPDKKPWYSGIMP